jgi:hypothetical protein
MKSTIENPIAYFEYVLDETIMAKVLFEEIENYNLVSFDFKSPSQVNCVEFYNNELFDTVYTIQDILLPILKLEFNKSKSLLKDDFLKDKPQDVKLLVTYHFNSIQSLVKNRASVISKHSFFLLPLRGLVKFLNERMLSPGMEPFVLNEEGIEFVSSNGQGNSFSKSNTDIILEVLGYMKNQNQRQEVILSEPDFNLLITYTVSLVENGEIPELTNKLNPNLSNSLILFSFWVLHKELYTTTQIRPIFFSFIKNVFKNLEQNEISSIRSQFGSKSRVTKDGFLPHIIKKHL